MQKRLEVSIPHRYSKDPQKQLDKFLFLHVSIPHRYSKDKDMVKHLKHYDMVFQSLIGILKTLYMKFQKSEGGRRFNPS